MQDRPLTRPEAVAASLVALLAVLIAAGYLWGRVATLSPFAFLGFTLATAALLTRAALTRSRPDHAASIGALAVFALALAWLLSLAWPTLLPPGSGPDLTHHLMLVDYIERRWQLPDASLVTALGEMAHYTPGVHLLSALTGAWLRSDGLHTMYAITATSVALKCTFVLLIALRSLPDSALRLPLAATAVVLTLLPKDYLLGSFAHDSFFAQTVSELFAVAMWWAVIAWQAELSVVFLVLFGAASVGTFLTWPVFIGAPVVTLVAIVVARFDLKLTDRVAALTVALAPLAAVAVIHLIGRVSWLGMAGTSGAVLQPSLTVLGVPFAAVAAAGAFASAFHRPARTTLVFALAILVQATTLFLVARSQDAATPYMAFKMVYLAIYPMAVLGVVGIGVVGARVPAVGGSRATQASRQVLTLHVATVAALLLLFAVYRKPLLAWPRHVPVVSPDLSRAGKWARANVEAACVDYLVPNADTMYWLHLAVLGNPRMSPRTADPQTFEPDQAVARWLQPEGLPYAIADLSTLTNEVANEVDVLEQFGSAAVVKRRGRAFCADAQRLAASWLTR